MSAKPIENTVDGIQGAYTEDEVRGLYDLGRFFLENGNASRADTIFQGLVQVAPTFLPAWLGIGAIAMGHGDFADAIQAAQQALKIDSRSVEALLIVISALLGRGDLQEAGTSLGEISERIESGEIADPNQIRYFKLQLARYQHRS